jgi:cephalosporin hydroxylase
VTWLRSFFKELKAFRRIAKRRLYLNAQDEGDLVGRFHTLFYDSHIFHDEGKNVFWLGTSIAKCPFDLWVYQEILNELKPDLIIECGTKFGGSAHFLASICDLLDCGEVITIDILEREGRPEHPRITYLTGSSVSEEILDQVRERVAGKATVMVLLDSDHAKDHVLAEMAAYGPMVTVESYLIVEDGNLNGHPVVPDFGPGPNEALAEFMKGNDDFEVDLDREKFLVSFNPRGYLRKRR